ncbi:Uncharacterised protein [uncultured archaeon]|nr:Uncharacterised protein [uncultured archaeon]
MRKTRILFILKKRDFDYGSFSRDVFSADKPTSGLYNSAYFAEKMLLDSGILCKLVEVTDNNFIDKEVHHFKPTHVIIEGLWVVPEKFEILRKLHPHVKWIVRIHSEIPFLSMEGIAIDWIVRYLKEDNLIVSCNSPKICEDLRDITQYIFKNWNQSKLEQKIILLPNYYPVSDYTIEKRDNREILNIGCFGAIRPLKNQLIQAVAAIKYANQHNLKLRFHMNGTRLEQGGANNFKNIQALFSHTNHELVVHPWMPHEEFLSLVHSLDLAMCVSFSETFCIVAADTVNQGVPLVASKEVFWCMDVSKANPTSVESIVSTIEKVLSPVTRDFFIERNHAKLDKYSQKAKKVWLGYFKR